MIRFLKTLFLTAILCFQLVIAAAAYAQTAAPAPDSAVSLERMEEGKVKFDAAFELYQQGRYEEAISPAKEALAIWEEGAGKDDPLISAGSALLAGIYDKAGMYEEAEQLYNKVLLIEIHNFGEDSKEAAATLNNLGGLYFRRGDYARAEPINKKALAIREKVLGPEHPDTAVSLNNLGALYDAKGQFEKAEELYRRALTVREKVLPANHPQIASTMSNLAAVYDATGRYAEAEPLYKKALAIMETAYGPEHPETATMINNLAYYYDAVGDYGQAEPLYLRALAVREKTLGPNHPLTALSLNNLAEFNSRFGDYGQALKLQERALAVRLETFGENNPETAQSWNNLALVHESMGNYDVAVDMLEKALAVWDKTLGPDHTETASAVSNLAELFKELGDFDRAEPLYRRAAAIREKAYGRRHESVALSLNNLAGFLQAKGDNVAAEKAQKEALDIYHQTLGPDHPDTATAMNNLAGIYFAVGMYPEARALHTRALEVRRRVLGPAHPDTAASVNNLAGLHFAEGDLGGAEKLYRESIETIEKTLGPNHYQLVPALENLAVLYAASGRAHQARPLLDRALEIDRKIIDRVMGFTSEEQKTKFLATRKRELAAYLSLASQYLAGDPEARRGALDVWLRRKGLILDTQRRFQEALVYWDAPEARQTFQELARAKSAMSRLVFAGPGPEGLDEYKKKLAEAEEKVDRLEGELSRLSQSFAERREVAQADSAKVAAGLPGGSVLLDFAKVDIFNFRTRNPKERWRPAHYIAFVLPAGATPKVEMVDLGEAEAVDKAVTDFKKAVTDLRDKDGKVLATASGKLYALVFGPIRPLLGEAKEIFISPDGNLNLIPFETVMTPEGRYLIEDYTFNYLTSGRDAMRFDQPVSGSPGPAVLMGDPDFNLAEEGKLEALARIGGAESDPNAPPPPVDEKPRGLRNIEFSRLAGTRDEVLAIKEVLDQAQVYLGPDVLEETLYKLEDPAILHLATHGFFLPDRGAAALMEQSRPGSPAGSGEQQAVVLRENPLRRSGLALAGANLSLKADGGNSYGILTAEKVLGLKLRDTEMVVLSACETGLGEVEAGEGVYGLRRAFTQTGANSLVMSMWSVPDLETKELMTEFYKNYQAGRKKPEALRAAALKMKQTVRTRYDTDHPFFWGAFVFMGKP